MKQSFSVLVIHGDGARVMRITLPGWIGYAALGVAAAALATMLALSGDYVWLREQSSQTAALVRRLGDQRTLLDAVQARAAAIRKEISDWKTLHAGMWDSFGPDVGSHPKGPGVGGASVPVPPPVSSIASPQDELELLASDVAEEGPRLRELGRLVSRTADLVNGLPLRWPIHGPVNSEFGLRRSPWNGATEQHDGIDIGSPAGTPVKSPAAGTVVVTSSTGDFGKHVILDHGNGVRSLYGHLREVDVKAGQRVEKGQVVGRVGSTGHSTGPHLHYELLVDGRPVDPRGFLWKR
jgi:murein DD-endopeptidase MepM/ murein hydrolase activator NlpD